MVDFDNESTITVDRSKIISVLILQRHSYVVDSLEKYDRLRYSNSKPPTNIVKSSIVALYNQVKGTIKKSNKNLFNEITGLLSSSEFEDFILAYEKIDDYLVDSGLTSFILNRGYDPKDPLAEDEAKGL